MLRGVGHGFVVLQAPIVAKVPESPDLRRSDTEHRLRDAKAIMRLRDFLPPTDSGICTFVVATVHNNGSATWPGSRIPADAGLVVLGRPALFGSDGFKIIETCRPVLSYSFEANDAGKPEYRTIVADDVTSKVLNCPSFEQQRRTSRIPPVLFDYGLVYSGWQPTQPEPRPFMQLAGTSTLGTWGAVKFVTDEVMANDMRWQEDVQGVVRAETADSPEAFDEVTVCPLGREMLTPCRIWMDGADLPPDAAGWKLAHETRSGLSEKPPPLDLRMVINGQEIMKKHRTYIPPLVLLAWASSGSATFNGGQSCKATAGEISESVRGFLGLSRRDWDLTGPKNHVYVTLNEMTKKVRGAGGIAFVRETRHGKDYHIVVRPLPPFLPRLP